MVVLHMEILSVSGKFPSVQDPGEVCLPCSPERWVPAAGIPLGDCKVLCKSAFLPSGSFGVLPSFSQEGKVEARAQAHD